MCGGGGCGKVLGIAASFVVPYFAPSMMATMGISSALGQTIGSSVIGGVISKATGGNFLSGAAGALIGSGVNAAFSGGAGFDAGNISNAFDSTVGSGAAPFSFQTGTPSSTAISAPISGEAGIDMGTSTMGLASNAGQTTPILGINPNDPTLVTQNMTSGMGGINGTGGNYGFTNTVPGNVDLAGNPGLVPQAPSGGGIFDSVNVSTALKALPQLAGAFTSNGPSTADMSGYLDNIREMDNKTFDFNANMANKKAAIGDNLATDAASMDPSYYGRQQMFATAGQAENQWADTEAKLRAQGYDENAISRERQKHQLSSSQAKGTAYDQGSQAGLNARNATFSTAGSMYGQIQGPTDRSGSYLALAKQGQDDASAAGAAIENLFKINQKDNKTGTTNTTVS